MAIEALTNEQRALDGIRQREDTIFHLMAQKRAEADLSREHADRADETADDYAAELAGLNAIREQLLLGQQTDDDCDLCAGPCTYKSPRSNT